MNRNSLIIKPPALSKNDMIEIVSPSSAIVAFPRRLKRGLRAIESWGFKTKLSKNCLIERGGIAGAPIQRAEDINDAFKDKLVQGIICSTGGWNANSILPFLDFDAIKENPKVFCGYSDITVLLNAIYAKTGLITFHGPTVLPSLGEANGVHPYSERSFLTLMKAEKVGSLPQTKEFTQELLWWEKEDSRPRKMKTSTPWKVLKEGTCEGRLIGGNTCTFATLIGTDYMPDVESCILLLEDEGGSTQEVERHLAQFKQVGILKKIAGLVYGRPYKLSQESSEWSLYEIIKEYTKEYDYPVLADVDFGHTEPRLTLPIGGMASIDTTKASFSIIEPVVSERKDNR